MTDKERIEMLTEALELTERLVRAEKELKELKLEYSEFEV
jgi:hypothetical protein|tara:strand:+ start:798 stop:917 length:120 start_codon:yes stop_codon:yes gene_type:complete